MVQAEAHWVVVDREWVGLEVVQAEAHWVSIRSMGIGWSLKWFKQKHIG